MQLPFTHTLHGTRCFGFQYLSILRSYHLYTLNAAVPYIFLATYRFNSGEQGLAYINFGIRVTPSLVIVISVAQHKTRKIRTTTVKGVRVKSSVEATLQLIRIGGLVLPIGILWWVWPLQTHVHWIGP